MDPFPHSPLSTSKTLLEGIGNRSFSPKACHSRAGQGRIKNLAGLNPKPHLSTAEAYTKEEIALLEQALQINAYYSYFEVGVRFS